MKLIQKVLMLSMIFVLFSAITALAAETWVQENGQWYCYDTNGNKITGKWKTVNGNQYYLDDKEGAMVTSSVVKSENDTYYCDENGVRVSNCWEKVPVDNGTDGYEYMYFGSTGRAVKNISSADPDKTIDGKKYRFTKEGYMLYGFLDECDEKVIYPSEADRYYGTRDDGAAVTGWVNIKNGGDAGCNGLYAAKSSVWFYYENGRKIKDIKEKSIGESHYGFDVNGAMLTGWNTVAGDGDYIGRLRYYGGPDDGILKKSTWIHAVDYDSDIPTEYDYYLSSTGVPLHSTDSKSVFRVEDKYYCFDANGRLVTGLVKGTIPPSSGITSFMMDAEEFVSYDGLKDLVLNQPSAGAMETILYFAENDVSEYEDDSDSNASSESDALEDEGEEAEVQKSNSDLNGKKSVQRKTGELCTGMIVNEMLPGRLYMNNKGLAYNGFKNGKIYNAGVLLVSEDGPSALIKLNKVSDRVNGLAYYLVNQSGKVLKNAIIRDENKYYWYADKDYVAYKFRGAVLGDRTYEQQAANAFKNGQSEFAVAGAQYKFIKKPKCDEDMQFMYYEVTWDYFAE